MLYLIAALIISYYSQSSDAWKLRAWNSRYMKAVCASTLISSSLLLPTGITSATAISCVDGCFSECMKVAPGEGSKEYCKTTCIDDCTASDDDTAAIATTSSQRDVNVVTSNQRTSRQTNNNDGDGAPTILDWIPEQMLKQYVESQKKYAATP